MRVEDLIEVAKALRRQADNPLAFIAKDDNVFDMKVACHYCGGHAFAVRAWLDHVIDALEAGQELARLAPLTRGAS